MYEHLKQLLASRKVFVQRIARNGIIGIAMLLIALGIGISRLSFLPASFSPRR